jgi:antagonist of KipI
MGGFAGRALRVGDRLQTGSEHLIAMNDKRDLYPLRLPDGGARLRAIPCNDRLFGEVRSKRFVISPRSDRMGYRLEGTAMRESPPGELVSAAVATGGIQVPPTGQPILLMADRATTGGYALAGVVITADLPLAGQLAPGDWIEFERCTPETADAALRQLEAALGAS